MIKDIVVHLTGSGEDEYRIAHAEAVASRFDAHLTGLQVHVLPQLIEVSDPAGSAFLQELLAESHQQAQAATDRLKERFGRLAVPGELRRLDVYPASAGRELARAARTADLCVGTRPYGDPTGQERIEEAVLFRSGRGCLLVPPGRTPAPEPGLAIVAWNDSREAARALAAALPLLQQMRQVVVALVEEEASESYGAEPGTDVARHLSRHGIAAEVRMLSGWTSAGDALLNEVNLTGADLLVMGAYGHSRLREWALGGATRDVLTEAEIPVLLAH